MIKTIRQVCAEHKLVVWSYIGGVIALILLSLFIYFFWPTFDADVAGLICQDRGKGFAGLMGFVSWWGVSYVMIGSVFAAAFLFFAVSYKREAWFLLGVFIADIVNVLLKVIINRHRPGEVVIFPNFQQASFPSGHVVHYVVFFGFILAVMLFNSRINMLLRWSIGLLCAFLIAGVSVARIYLGTHWASDILPAYIIGFVMLAILILIYARKKPL